MSSIEQKLGFDRIRQMVAEQCTNALAVRMADEMHFMTDQTVWDKDLDEEVGE